jgi:hypothetical protein
VTFPSVRSENSSTQTSNSTSWAITMPATVVAGDLLYLFIARDGTTGAGSISDDTGWSLLAQENASTIASMRIFVKVAVGDESGATYHYAPGASEQGIWRVAAFQDWYGAISGGVEYGGVATGSSNAPNAGSFAPSWGSGKDTRWRTQFAQDDGRGSVNTYPSGWTINQNDDASGGSGGASGGGASLDSTTSPQDAPAWLLNRSDNWVAVTVAIRPSAAVTNSGSFTADAYIKKTLSGTFTADAYIKNTIAGSFTANAYVQKTSSGTFTSDAYISKTTASSFTADAYIFKTIAGSLTADAYISRLGIAGSFTADAYVQITVAGTFTADSEIQGLNPDAPVWVSPLDTATVTETPVLVFTMPSGPSGDYHFQLELDTVNTFDSGNYAAFSTYVSQTGWEYEAGGTVWTPVPSTGVPSTEAGNDVRYTVQSPLAAGTWYRRVRAGF